MKIKNIVKIILDAVMVVLFTTLFFAEDTGLVFHEIVGLSVLFILGLHLVLNGQWIVSTTKNLGKKRIKAKTSRMYFLNITLLIGIIVIITTGIMISTVVLPLDGYNPTIEHVHECAAYLTGCLLIIHVALHIKYLKASVKAILRSLKLPITRRTFIGAFAMLLMLVILYYNIISAVSKNIDGDTLTQTRVQKDETMQISFLEKQPTIKGSESEPKNTQEELRRQHNKDSRLANFHQ